MRLAAGFRVAEIHAGQQLIHGSAGEVDENEAHVMMFEPKSTAHTGTTESSLTIEVEDQRWI